MTTFAVHRKEPLLVNPAEPTPRETKRLSNIDDREHYRMHVRVVFFYRGACQRDDPAIVTSSGAHSARRWCRTTRSCERWREGNWWLTAPARACCSWRPTPSVRLEELEAAGLRPPFPCADQLLFDVEGSSGVLNSPLLLIQVTRLLCGGFVFAICFNHTMCDGTGIVQFLSAVAEHARGLPAPSVTPACSRELLEMRKPPKPVFPHREFSDIPPPPLGDIITRTFIFGSADVTAIKKSLPPHLQNEATSFEELKFPELMLPTGYYGNAGVLSVLPTTAGTLLAGLLGDAVELVRKAKAQVTAAEYERWCTLDFQMHWDQPCMLLANLFLVSDIRHVGLHHVDFGWGEPVYGGFMDGMFIGNGIVTMKNENGEDVVAVPVALPCSAMDRFSLEIDNLLKACY
ncbi:hypothetical protein EJB05_35220, partial [Eragrostis curvula]